MLPSPWTDRLIGGPVGVGDATMLGIGERFSVFGAAFANGELINTLDMDAVVLPGHVTPYVLPGIMGVGKQLGKSGKSDIEVISISHETSHRHGNGYLCDTKDSKVDPRWCSAILILFSERPPPSVFCAAIRWKPWHTASASPAPFNGQFADRPVPDFSLKFDLLKMLFSPQN